MAGQYRLLGIAILAGLAMAPVMAVADDAPAAASLSMPERTRRSKALYDLGRAQFNVGDYSGATASFTAAYEYRPLALFLYNLGQVALAAKDDSAALRFFERYLAEEPRAPERVELERQMIELRARLAARPAEAAQPPPIPSPSTVTEPPPPLTLAASPPLVVSIPPGHEHTRHLGWWAVAAGVVLAGAITTVLVVHGEESAPSSSWGNQSIFH